MIVWLRKAYLADPLLKMHNLRLLPEVGPHNHQSIISDLLIPFVMGRHLHKTDLLLQFPSLVIQPILLFLQHFLPILLISVHS